MKTFIPIPLLVLVFLSLLSLWISFNLGVWIFGRSFEDQADSIADNWFPF